MIDAIRVRGARVHNLKNVDVDVPLNKIVGIAGVSGSGKSSLALGVLYAVLAIHLIGIAYMAIIVTIKGDGWPFMKGWIINQSGWKVVFDYVLSFALVYFTRLLRPLMWCYKKPY